MIIYIDKCVHWKCYRLADRKRAKLASTRQRRCRKTSPRKGAASSHAAHQWHQQHQGPVYGGYGLGSAGCARAPFRCLVLMFLEILCPNLMIEDTNCHNMTQTFPVLCCYLTQIPHVVCSFREHSCAACQRMPAKSAMGSQMTVGK